MTDIDAYKTISIESEAEFKDRGSKFIAYLRPVNSAEEFQSFMVDIKNIHFKARHHCFAYRLLDTDKFRYSDDGEPSGTAGKPIFNQLLSNELVNTACIVVRYFGGTKLGTSGLINAYKQSAKEAIIVNTIETRYLEATIHLYFDYAIMGNVMNALKQLNLSIDETDFGETPNLKTIVHRSSYIDTKLRIKAQLLGRSIEDVNEDTKVEGLKIME